MEPIPTIENPKPTVGRRIWSAVIFFFLGAALGLPLYGVLEQLTRFSSQFGVVEKIACLGEDGLGCVLLAPIFFGIVFAVLGFFFPLKRKALKVLSVIVVLLLIVAFFSFY